MDSRDLLILGGVAVVGVFGWRWWRNRAVTNVPVTAGSSDAAMIASSMRSSAARTTVFDGAILAKRLLAPSPALRRVGVALTAAAADSPDLKTDPALSATVLRAILGPQPVAPSPSNTRFTSAEGISSARGEQPSGAAPSPGSPGGTFFSLRGIG